MDSYIINKNSLARENMNKYESLMCLGNGYIGMRNTFWESCLNQKRATLINGVFDRAEGETPEIVLLPDSTKWELIFDGEPLEVCDKNTEEYSEILNMKTGETKRCFIYTLKNGKKVEVCFKTIVSMKDKHIISSKLTLMPFCDMKVCFKTGIDGAVTNSGTAHFGAPKRKLVEDSILSASYTTLNSCVHISCAAKVLSSFAEKQIISADKRGIYAQIDGELKANLEYEVEKITAYSTSRDLEYINDKQTDRETVEIDNIEKIKSAAKIKYDGLYEQSKLVWEKFWEENAVTIKAKDGFYQKAVNFALYHLNIMSNKEDIRLGIGAKGLSGEAYGGHSFWDTEIFILPYFIYTNPDAAKNLLIYRYLGLKKAEEKAKRYGYHGAMYPWEAAWCDDGECCPEYFDFDVLTLKDRDFPAPKTELHITGAIAFAVEMYYRVTDDTDFMEKYGYEIIIKTADFWQSRAESFAGGYGYLNVTGPDEYKDEVDNNAYTNYLAHYNMRLLIKYKNKIPQRLYDELGVADILDKVTKVVEGLYLPKPDKNDIIPQNDGYGSLIEIDISGYKNTGKVSAMFSDYNLFEIQKMQVGKQADVIMLFVLFPNLFDNEIIKKNFEFYEKRTLHDSSLSMCMHSLMAAKNRMYDEAECFFRNACEVDVGENTKNSDEGIHAASIGGIWQALVFGWAGVECREDTMIVNPIIPDAWEEYAFPITFKESKMIVTVSHSGINVERILGNEVNVIINGKKELI